VNLCLNLANAVPLLEQNGFAIVEHDFGRFDPNLDDIVKPSKYLKNNNVPIFITADTLLHLYHIQFDETLKDIKEREFYVDMIIVACPAPDGSIFLAAEPVLSYFELKHPMNDRLTDEAWRDMLVSPEKPDRPLWFQVLVK
jgi:hypothetical protein